MLFALCPKQELNSFKKFSDSLLSKSSKLHNLLSELEDYIPEMSDGADKKKAEKQLRREEQCNLSYFVQFRPKGHLINVCTYAHTHACRSRGDVCVYVGIKLDNYVDGL